MEPLTIKINEKWDATAALTSGFGATKLYIDRADGVAKPFCVLSVIAAPTNVRFASQHPYTAVIQFTVIAATYSSAMSLSKTLTDTFDDFQPTLTTGHCYDARRTSQPFAFRPPPGEVSKDTDVSDVWQVVVTYEYTVMP